MAGGSVGLRQAVVRLAGLGCDGLLVGHGVFERVLMGVALGSGEDPGSVVVGEAKLE